jgi:hypothetical protein
MKRIATIVVFSISMGLLASAYIGLLAYVYTLVPHDWQFVYGLAAFGGTAVAGITAMMAIDVIPLQKKKLPKDALECIVALSNYTTDRGLHPQCAFCGADMQDNLSNVPGNAGDGGDPEHLESCCVIKARHLRLSNH